MQSQAAEPRNRCNELLSSTPFCGLVIDPVLYSAVMSPEQPPGKTMLICHNGRTKLVTQEKAAKHIAKGDSPGACPNDDKVVICHNGQNKLVSQKDVAKHVAKGDTAGFCPGT